MNNSIKKGVAASGDSSQTVSTQKVSYCEPPINTAIGISPEFNLLDSDLERRGKSFLDEKTLRLAGIRRITDDQGHQNMGYDWRKKGFFLSGLAIPYFDVLNANDAEGGLKILEFNIRRDFPDKVTLPNGEIKEERKYMKPSRPNLLYIFPQIRPEGLRNKKIFKIITEGEFKAAAMFRALSKDFTSDELEHIPLAVSGVENWKAKRNIVTPHGEKIEVNDFLIELENIGIKGQTFVLLFDSDKDEKPQVTAAFWRLTNALRKRGAKVLHAECPKEFNSEKTKGIDDFLGAVERSGGDPLAALLAILKDAEKPKKPSSTIIPERFILREFGEDKPGVYYLEETGEETFVCPPLKVLAKTEDAEGERVGRLLEWKDDAGRIKQWAMPIEFVYADGAELVKHLASRGLNISPLRKNRERIAVYIQSVTASETITSTDKLGWHGECFVLPDETIGEAESKVVYQTLYEGHHNFKTSDTLLEWQKNISRFCSGNSNLIVAVSTAFASPLLPIVNEKGAGLHFLGSSSLGKTTVISCAGSVWGGGGEHGFILTWKTTSNGLEIVASSHNHALLCLDEIGECEPREIGRLVYMLPNGIGKIRMDKTLQRRKTSSWNLFYLSTGEKSLDDIISEMGGNIKGGQEIRLINIEAKTDKYGIFEDLHEFESGAALSYHLRSASLKFYGTASREFLRFLTETDFDSIRQKWESAKSQFIADCLKETKETVFSPEVGRVAGTFALIALAGELATEANITGWKKDEAYEAVKQVFLRWFDARGGNTRSDEEKAFRQVVEFFEANPARFQDVESPDQTPINRAGYVKRNTTTGETTYFVTTGGFREITKGFNYKDVAELLFNRGFLINIKAEPIYIGSGIGTKRVYELKDVTAATEKTKAANNSS